jgi:hypothetical protein
MVNGQNMLKVSLPKKTIAHRRGSEVMGFRVLNGGKCHYNYILLAVV